MGKYIDRELLIETIKEEYPQAYYPMHYVELIKLLPFVEFDIEKEE